MSRRYHTNTTTESNIYSDIDIPSNLLDTDNLFEEQWGGARAAGARAAKQILVLQMRPPIKYLWMVIQLDQKHE